MRAVIYCRASLDLTGQGASVGRQEDACRALCAARGYTVVDVKIDNSISAYSGKKRPAWEELQTMLRDGRADVVVAWALDRITRSMTDLEALINLTVQTGTGIVTATGDIDLSTDTGRLIARILAAVARGEVERKAERQKLSHQTRVREGRMWKGGPRPLGYRHTEQGTVLVEEEAGAMRWAVEQVLRYDAPLTMIRDEWEQLGIVNYRGKPYSISGLKLALTSPRSAGVITHRGEQKGQGNWPAIFDMETHLAIRRALCEDPNRLKSIKHNLGRKPSALLSALEGTTCGKCGAPLTVTRRRGVQHYTCRTPQHCATARVALVDRAVEAEVVGLLSSDHVSAQRLTTSDEQGALAARELAAIDERLAGVTAAFTAGAITVPQLTEMASGLNARKAELELQIQQAALGSAFTGLALGTAEVAEQWVALPLERRRTLISRLFEVAMHPANGYAGGQERWSADRHLAMTLKQLVRAA